MSQLVIQRELSKILTKASSWTGKIELNLGLRDADPCHFNFYEADFSTRTRNLFKEQPYATVVMYDRNACQFLMWEAARNLLPTSLTLRMSICDVYRQLHPPLDMRLSGQGVTAYFTPSDLELPELLGRQREYFSHQIIHGNDNWLSRHCHDGNLLKYPNRWLTRHHASHSEAETLTQTLLRRIPRGVPYVSVDHCAGSTTFREDICSRSGDGLIAIRSKWPRAR